MTNEDIDRMQAGPELVRLIAEKVMGWHGAVEETFWPSIEWVWRDARGYKVHGPTDFSTNIAAAWRVVEKMRLSLIPTLGGDFQCDTRADTKIPYVEAHGPAPLAICRAALKAKLMELKR
jgi:Phage ABA sandwich domain